MYELWAWLVKEEDGTEGAIAAVLPGMPGMGPCVLQGRTKLVADRMSDLAHLHGLKTGRPVRLVHLKEVE